MVDWAVSHVPVKHRSEIFVWLFVAFAFVAGFFANFGYRAHSYTQVRVTHPSVSQILGTPAQSIAGAQVNSQLAGFVCDIYQSPAVLYCHR